MKQAWTIEPHLPGFFSKKSCDLLSGLLKPRPVYDLAHPPVVLFVGLQRSHPTSRRLDQPTMNPLLTSNTKPLWQYRRVVVDPAEVERFQAPEGWEVETWKPHSEGDPGRICAVLRRPGLPPVLTSTILRHLVHYAESKGLETVVLRSFRDFGLEDHIAEDMINRMLALRHSNQYGGWRFRWHRKKLTGQELWISRY
jgi:hypothetical protein